MPDETPIVPNVELEEGQEPVPAVLPETATEEEVVVVDDEDEEDLSEELD